MILDPIFELWSLIPRTSVLSLKRPGQHFSRNKFTLFILGTQPCNYTCICFCFCISPPRVANSDGCCHHYRYYLRSHIFCSWPAGASFLFRMQDCYYSNGGIRRPSMYRHALAVVDDIMVIYRFFNDSNRMQSYRTFHSVVCTSSNQPSTGIQYCRMTEALNRFAAHFGRLSFTYGLAAGSRSKLPKAMQWGFTETNAV